ncbi:MAG TPA: heme ABC exporter ATP-binding protein CcmA [Steroidobacteraceae bacterium]|nr:heme ABC exporter ATP-binding protein CcmA [Steroidobacteraceae bacterium]
MSNLKLRGEGLHLWRGDRHVLRGVSLELHGGDILQLTGSNGAGKTTLLRILCGLVYPEEGRVLWGDADVRKDLSAYHAQLAYVGHEPPLKADLNARENLHYWVGVRRRLAAGDIEKALDEVGADEWRDRAARTLSAGQRRRVALAGLTLLAAPLWLLDEPTTNLDTAGQTLVSRLIEEHVTRGGLVVAAVHHDLPVQSRPVRRLDLVTT